MYDNNPAHTHSYVSRVSRSSNIDHFVLGTTQYKPGEFAERMLNLKPSNMWGIIKWLCDKFLAGDEPLEPGKRFCYDDAAAAAVFYGALDGH